MWGSGWVLLALTVSDFGDGVKKELSVVRTRAIECEKTQTMKSKPSRGMCSADEKRR